MNAKKKSQKSSFHYGVYIPLICFIFFSALDVYTNVTQNWATYVLSNLLIILLGYQIFFFGAFHVFFGDKIAGYIGWEKGSPFQYEVGISGMAIGTLGILCQWFTGEFWLATIIVSSIFLWGCSIGHIVDMIKKKNFNPGSAGYVFWWDTITPIAMIVLYLIK